MKDETEGEREKEIKKKKFNTLLLPVPVPCWDTQCMSHNANNFENSIQFVRQMGLNLKDERKSCEHACWDRG